VGGELFKTRLAAACIRAIGDWAAMDFSRFKQNVRHPPPPLLLPLIPPPPLHSQHGLINDTAFYAVSGGIFGGCVGAVKVRSRLFALATPRRFALSSSPPFPSPQAAWAGAPRAAIPLSQAITGAGRSVGSSAVTFAAIAGTYKAVSSITEGVRGRSVRSPPSPTSIPLHFAERTAPQPPCPQDVWNGVAGGLAAGAVIAVKTQRGVVGAGAGLCYAALSAITEYNDNTLTVSTPSLPPCQTSNVCALQPSNDTMQTKHAAVERAH